MSANQIQEALSTNKYDDAMELLKKWYKDKPGRIHELCDVLKVTPSSIYRLNTINGYMREKTWNRIVKAIVKVLIKEASLDENDSLKRRYWDTEPYLSQFRKMEFEDYFKHNPTKIASFNKLIGIKKLVQRILNKEIKYSYFYHDAFLNFVEGKRETYYTRIDNYFKKDKKLKLKLCYEIYNREVPDYSHKHGAHIFWRYCYERKNVRNRRTILIIEKVIEECKKTYS